MGVKARKTIGTILVTALMSCVALVALFPFYYIFIGSIQDQTYLFANGLQLYVTKDTFSLVENYTNLFQYNNGEYILWYKNSILITFFYTILSLVLSSLVGYGLGAYQFKLRNVTFILVLMVMMVPLEIIMLPLYKLSVELKIINTYAGVILPFMCSSTAIFFFRQFVIGIPKDLMEAGRIDGCTEVGIFIRIITPIMKPAYGAMMILLAMLQWNAFLWPLIVMRTSDQYTIPLGIATMIGAYVADYSALLSGSVLSIVPIMIVFFCNQKFFIAGLTSGAVKG